jgi:hypothetical protein
MNKGRYRERPPCVEYQLPKIEIPEGCHEVIELLKKFTNKAQWSFIRIVIEQYEPR